tara:strand:+ start:6698 stop:9805 length:3108 start_codon:yes stop_codon:yes gene_type:complete
MPNESNKKLTIQFDAQGDKKLISAINRLANAQSKLTSTTKKANKTNKKYRHRVDSNTKAIEKNNAMLIKAQGIIAQYRNRMLLAAFAVTFVQKAMVGFVNMAATQEASVRRLAAVFGGELAKGLDEYSSQLQGISVYGDEVINNVMAMIGSFGANVKQTKELTRATLDLAAGLNLDLSTAGLLIAKTFGSTTNALIRYGVSVEATASKSEKLAAITGAIEAKWGGLAEVLAQTTEGQLAQASNAWGDFLEEIGKVLTPVVLAGAKALKTFSESLNEGRIKKFSAAIVVMYTAYKVLNTRLLRTFTLKRMLFVRIIKLNRAFVTATATANSYALANGLAAGATGTFSSAVLILKTRLHALYITMLKNPFIAIAMALTAAGVAVLNAKGYFDDTNDTLDGFAAKVQQAAEQQAKLNKAIDDSEAGLKKKLDLLNTTSTILQYRIEQDRSLTVEEIRLLNAIRDKNKALAEEKNALSNIDSIVSRSIGLKERRKEELKDAQQRKSDLEKRIEENRALEAKGQEVVNQGVKDFHTKRINSLQADYNNRIKLISENQAEIKNLEAKMEDAWIDAGLQRKKDALVKENEAIRKGNKLNLDELKSMIEESKNELLKFEETPSIPEMIAKDEALLAKTNKAINQVTKEIKNIDSETKKLSAREQFQLFNTELELTISAMKAGTEKTKDMTDEELRLAIAKEKVKQISTLLYKTDEEGNIIKVNGVEVRKDEKDMIISSTAAQIMLNNAKAEENSLSKEQLKTSQKLTAAQEAQHKGILAISSALNTMGTETVGNFATSFTTAYDSVKGDLEGLMEEEEAHTEAIRAASEQVGMEMAAMAIGALMRQQEAKMQMLQEQGRAELDSLKSSRRYDKLSAKQKKEAEDKITKETNKQLQKQFKVQQQLNYAAVIMDTSMAIMKAMATIPPPANIPIAVMTGVMGAVQLAEIAKQKPPKMAQGGLIKGLPHSQGGAMINAEGGEFVMSKRAVETAGLETMNRINRGQGAAAPVNVSFSGNINSDEFIESEAIPKIKEAIRRGADIGVE